MRNLKWFCILAFAGGGLLVVAVLYLLLRSSGYIYKLTPDNDDKWVEYDT